MRGGSEFEGVRERERASASAREQSCMRSPCFDVGLAWGRCVWSLIVACMCGMCCRWLAQAGEVERGGTCPW